MTKILRCNQRPDEMKIVVEKEVNKGESAFIWIMGHNDCVFLSKSDCIELAKELVDIAEEIE